MKSAKDFAADLKKLKRTSEELDKKYLDNLAERDELKRKKQKVIKTQFELLKEIPFKKRTSAQHGELARLNERYETEIKWESEMTRRTHRDKGYHAFTRSEYMKAHQEYRPGGK